MAFNPGHKARILLGDFSLSAKANDMSIPHTVDMHDVTTYADAGVKRFLAGLEGGDTASISGFVDVDLAGDAADWTDQQPLTFAPYGLSLGSRVIMVDTLRAGYEIGSQVAGVVSFTLTGQVDGLADLGVSLTDLAAFTTDTNGTAVDGGAASSNGGVGHLHVTAYSGFTDVNVTIEGSANGSSGWATVATFSQFTDVTSQRVEVSGSVARYLRVVVDVDGSGSVTLQSSFARR